MSFFFEHDDLVKSRRAVVTASIITMALHHVVLNSNELEIFKLKIAIDQNTLILWGKLSVIYLLLNYLYFAVSSVTERHIEKARQAAEQGNHFLSQSDNKEALYASLWVRRREQLILVYELLVPLAVSLLALTDFHVPLLQRLS